jgi:chromosome segregation ATPase
LRAVSKAATALSRYFLGTTVGLRRAKMTSPTLEHKGIQIEDTATQINELEIRLARAEGVVAEEEGKSIMLQNEIRSLERQEEQIERQLKSGSVVELQDKLAALKREEADCRISLEGAEMYFPARCDVELSRLRDQRNHLIQEYHNLTVDGKGQEALASAKFLEEAIAKLHKARTELRKRRSRIQYIEGRLSQLSREELKLKRPKVEEISVVPSAKERLAALGAKAAEIDKDIIKL